MIEVTPAGPAPRRASGFLAMALAVLIWAGWIVAVRASVTTSVGPIDIALLRYGIPALVLAPALRRVGILPRGVARWRIVVMTLGWGAPFAMLAAQGARSAPTAQVAALVPGSMPLWVALITVVALGARHAPRGRFGLGLIAIAVAMVVVPALAGRDPGALAGAPWLVAASFGWACYAVAYRGSGMGPVAATAVVAFWSTLGLIPVALIWGEGLSDLGPIALAEQVLMQGVLAGVVAVIAFAVAIRALGAGQATAFLALVPVLSALGGTIVLGEALTVRMAVAILAASAGVALVNSAGVTFRPQPSRR